MKAFCSQCLLIVLAASLVLPCLAQDGDVPPRKDTIINTFDNAEAIQQVTLTDASAKHVRHNGGRALELRFKPAERPTAAFTPSTGHWDWRGYEGVAIEVHNPGKNAIELWGAVRSEDAEGRRLLARSSRMIDPGETTAFHLFLTNKGTGPFKDLRAIPEYGVITVHGPSMAPFTLEPSRVTAFELYIPNAGRDSRLVVDNLRAFAPGSPDGHVVPWPFVDRYGQYKHRDWPGKVTSDADLVQQRDDEARALEQASALPGRDRFGGWADGPQLEATGWFRTEKVDGKWWLVTPEGRLFLSFGVNCVRFGDSTRIAGCEDWFEEIPEDNNFYLANVKRKYGEGYNEKWRDRSYARLRSWGINTIGNWSAEDVLRESPMPYTCTLGVQGALPRVEGSYGFWSKLCEVFDPEFERIAGEIVAKGVVGHKDNPLCIGYFVDNEMAWSSVHRGILASPPEQLSRIAFIEQLKQKYATIEALNGAWETDAKDWDSLQAPRFANAAATEDLDAFAHTFARRYFDTIAAALKKHAPNQLYLGCRFSMEPVSSAVIRACADVVDVVSVNLYVRGIACESWTGANDYGKPVIIGEFHLGAADRAMLHPGLVPCSSQAERADGFKAYVKTIVDCPSFVGCHWFKYCDQPLTGRVMDLECFNVGLIFETDLPYPEMVDAMRDAYGRAYTERYNGSPR